MNIGIASPITIPEFYNYLDSESLEKAKMIPGMRAPAVDVLVLGLLERGHNVSVYTLDKNVTGLVVLSGEHLSIFVVPFSGKSLTKLFGIFSRKPKQIRKCIEFDKRELDILHAHWTHEYAIASLKYRNKVPIIVTVRDWAPTILKLNYKNYYYYVHYILDWIVFKHKKVTFISNSSYIYQKILSRWGIESFVIQNPINTNFLIPPKTKDIEYVHFNILSISNGISKNKNINNLLEAFHLLTMKYNALRLILVGNDFKKDNPYVKKWQEAGLMEHVILYGHVSHDKLTSVFDESNLLVHPSLEESFGNVFIEAMARKVPVIGGKNSGAVPSLLGNGKYGYLCDVENVESLANAIEYLYLSPNIRRQMADSSYSYVIESFSSDSIVEKTLQIYNKLIVE